MLWSTKWCYLYKCQQIIFTAAMTLTHSLDPRWSLIGADATKTYVIKVNIALLNKTLSILKNLACVLKRRHPRRFFLTLATILPIYRQSPLFLWRYIDMKIFLDDSSNLTNTMANFIVFKSQTIHGNLSIIGIRGVTYFRAVLYIKFRRIHSWKNAWKNAQNLDVSPSIHSMNLIW